MKREAVAPSSLMNIAESRGCGGLDGDDQRTRQLEPELLGPALRGLGLGPSKCPGRAALRTLSQRLSAF